MANPTPGTQLARVLDLMLDEQWRTPAEIAQATGDREASITSRIRDLRLSSYGGHYISSRKRDATLQIWEYRLVVPIPASALERGQAEPADVVTVGAIPVPPNRGRYGVEIAAQATIGPPVKFLNTDTLRVEEVSRDRCRVDSSLPGFNRVVATDAQGNTRDNLVTTQMEL